MIFKSTTSRVVELTVVVVPLTVKSPVTVKFVNAPSDVIFGCAAVDNVPTNAEDDIEVRPLNVVLVPPNAIVVDPIVIPPDNAELGIFVNPAPDPLNVPAVTEVNPDKEVKFSPKAL